MRAVERDCVTDEATPPLGHRRRLADYLEKLCLQPGTVGRHADAIKTMDEPRGPGQAALMRERRRLLRASARSCSPGMGIDMREFERVVLLRRGGPPLDGPHRRHGPSCATASACAPTPSATRWWSTRWRATTCSTRWCASSRRIPCAACIQARRGAPRRSAADSGQPGAATPVGASQGAAARPREPAPAGQQGGPQRSLPLRQRQEVQELLRCAQIDRAHGHEMLSQKHPSAHKEVTVMIDHGTA